MVKIHVYRNGVPIRTLDAAPAAQRKLVDMTRDKDRLYVQPTEVSAEREVWEKHNRERAAFHGFYADRETGNPHSFDSAHGRYACGNCNMVTSDRMCTFLAPGKQLPQNENGVGPVDMKSGSCEHFEEKRAEDSELRAFNMVDNDGYGVAANGHGFGCPVCPYAEKRTVPDSGGRTLWCKFWATAVDAMACCKYNAAPTV